MFTTAYQRHLQEDVPLYHKIAGSGYTTYNFDPQQRDLAYLKWEFFTDKKWLKEIRFIQSFQNSIEGRIKQKTNDTTIKSENDKVNIFGIVLELVSKPAEYWSISSGAEYYYDKVNSSAFEHQENSQVQNVMRGALS